MNTKENAPELAGSQGGKIITEKQFNSSTLSHKTKEGKVAIALMRRSFNRFEAARELHDWCLHSTAATLQSKGITVNRVFESIPNYQGKKIRVCRYWIDASEHQKVNRMLGGV
ncbi:MAG: hypothetical protein KME37_07760 [Candidatus Thiodiazotropha sp. (ex Codakia orbicularis)]|nr:hypothetical protein [Candidatus Thiodiazotropha sp. (ex Codakia orbicularis)]